MFGEKKYTSLCFTKEVWVNPGTVYPLLFNWTRSNSETVATGTLLFTYIEPTYDGEVAQLVTIRYQLRGSTQYVEKELYLPNQITITVSNFESISIVTTGTSGKAKLNVEGSIFFESSYPYTLSGLCSCIDTVPHPLAYKDTLSVNQRLLPEPFEQVVWSNQELSDSVCVVCLQENSSSLKRTVEGNEVVANSLCKFTDVSGTEQTFTLRHDAKCPSIIVCDGIYQISMTTNAETGESDATIDVHSSYWKY